ncbi:hypothetical protein PGUG_03179 [Meyerozyma guilliermondii ATCC 6260]|uniref:Uncharacterized protein n=1 Tax=Meyerozyma guilliermondii (strain ATCC 6260 / CBS 566 / DSM 6381 / JCM 1539 / NBRC 10279 / NRRL Y-324) TaxID=294746 RepID=A5DIS8_PICGU|nr:uncharacterized protein PGUG_03179 [Meyerozyma guilliermondii ATCC 6260]EDK39081.2 hypothetical protein PGUG_03179 [Meyerozyma guilliermondii ATCC 6260]
MTIASIAPIAGEKRGSIPLTTLLRLNHALQKSIFSRKFYQQISDKVLASTATVDANLYFICYFTLLVSSVLNNKPQIRFFLAQRKHQLLQLLRRAVAATMGSDLRQSSNKKVAEVFSGEKPSWSQYEHKGEKPVSSLAVHLKAISSYLSDIRIFNRLTDSIKYMPWIIDEFAAMVKPGDSVPRSHRVVNFVQSINCLVLELFENAGWLTDHNWVGTGDNDYWCMETYIWCSRVWGLYLVLEVVELFRRVPISKWDANWRLSLFKQVVQLPLVVHWSLREGCLSPFWVGLFGSGASWWGFRDLWGSIDLS